MVINRLFQRIARMSHSQKLKLTKPCFTIAVEGNIGSGKTTFIQHMESLGNVTILSEPVDLWRNCNGHNLLELMYQNPQKWAFTFQSYIQLTMLQNHALPVETPIKIMERSIHSARYCFVEKMAQDGILAEPAYSVLDEWFKWICQNCNTNVDLFVYLKTDPEVAFERILKRNRSEERSVPFEYIQHLHNMHEKWLIDKSLSNFSAPVFVLDANKDLSVIQDEYSRFEDGILKEKFVANV